jgi:hypothetical protein
MTADPDRRGAPWLIITIRHPDRVTENFADQLVAGLAAHGHPAFVAVHGPELGAQLAAVPLAELGGVIAIGPLPLGIRIGDQPLYQLLRCPFHFYILDTLLYDLLRFPFAAQFIADAWNDPRLVPVFAEKCTLDAWRAGPRPLAPPHSLYVPFAAFPEPPGPRPAVPVQRRLLVVGSIGTELAAGTVQRELAGTLAESNAMALSGNELARVAERLLAPGARSNVVLDLFDVLQLAPRAALEPAVQAFACAADSFMKRHRRLAAAQSLRGLPVDFAGSGWQQAFGDEPSFRFLGNLPHSGLTRLMTFYAGLVNFDPNWEWGMHDRVYSALSVGTPVLTNANRAPADEGLPAPLVATYVPNAPALAAPAQALLDAPPAREPVRAIGWSDRVGRLLAPAPIEELAA